MGWYLGTCGIPKRDVFEWETWRFHEVIYSLLGHLGLRWKLVLFAHFLNWGAKPSSFVQILQMVVSSMVFLEVFNQEFKTKSERTLPGP